MYQRLANYSNINVQYRCKAPYCKNYYRSLAGYFDDKSHVNKHFFQCPSKAKEPERNAAWKAFCGIDADSNVNKFKLCDEHFPDKCILNNGGFRPRLAYNTVPSIHTRINHAHVDSINLDHSYDRGNNFESNNEIDMDHDYCKAAGNENISEEVPPSSGYKDVSEEIPPAPENENIVQQIPPPENENISKEILPPFGNENILEEDPHSSTAFLYNRRIISTSIVNGSFSYLNQEKKDAAVQVYLPLVAPLGYQPENTTKQKELSPEMVKMKRVYKNALSRISKLKRKLKESRESVIHLKKLHEKNRFEFIERELTSLQADFIDCQLRNCTQKPSAKRYTDRVKVFAVNLYKRSPATYRYLMSHFDLPCPRTLSKVRSVELDTALNEDLLRELEMQVQNAEKLAPNPF